MLWSHSPRPQGFACPGLGLLGPSVPPHDPSPGPHTPGGNSRGSPLKCPKKGDHSGEITSQGGGTGRDHICRGSLCFASLSMG